MFRDHPNELGKFICVLCNKAVKSRWHHEQTHFFRDHRCPYCDAVYSRLDTLKSHTKRMHQANVNLGSLMTRYGLPVYPHLGLRSFLQANDFPTDLSTYAGDKSGAPTDLSTYGGDRRGAH